MSTAKESKWGAPPYEPNRVVRIPESIPELGFEPGEGGCIDSVYSLEDGTSILLVEVSGPEAPCDALINVLAMPDGALRVVSYSRLGC